MGREATGTIRTAVGQGKAKILLETDELIFRGEVRARVPFRTLTVVEPGPDGLRLVWPDGDAVVDLAESRGGPVGPTASGTRPACSTSWACRTGPGSPSSTLATPDSATTPSPLELADRDVQRVPAGPADVVVWGLDEAADLARLPSLIKWIQPAGALWAVWAKGRKELNENHIREAALDAGLVDVKVARFSATHSALKLVVPKARRLGGHS